MAAAGMASATAAIRVLYVTPGHRLTGEITAAEPMLTKLTVQFQKHYPLLSEGSMRQTKPATTELGSTDIAEIEG